MTELRPLMIDAMQYDCRILLAEWTWLTPPSDTPLFISAFGDWVFGNPDGSLWVLSVLEGNYTQVARNSQEYNALNKSSEWLEQVFIAGWLPIAAEHGLMPRKDQCLGWKVHPLVGGKLTTSNLQVFEMTVYQSIMGQFHLQLQQAPAPGVASKSWSNLW
ncbi:MAG: hypothetical protein KDI37_14430 [Xanthomonadales bacterium]|nr:hypothetical protein [Xanthomonadales bacterium]MCB1642924.1 hypothetical protein [Xanthomonadales bacterium]